MGLVKHQVAAFLLFVLTGECTVTGTFGADKWEVKLSGAQCGLHVQAAYPGLLYLPKSGGQDTPGWVAQESTPLGLQGEGNPSAVGLRAAGAAREGRVCFLQWSQPGCFSIQALSGKCFPSRNLMATWAWCSGLCCLTLLAGRQVFKFVDIGLVLNNCRGC